MYHTKGGAVATTAKGGSPKRDAVATGDSHNIFKYTVSRPEVSPNFFKGWRSLTVKYNGRKRFASEEKLMRVYLLICSILGFETTDAYETEYGEQKRLHIHAIVRAKKLYNIEDATAQLKVIGSVKFPIFSQRQMLEHIDCSKTFIEFDEIDLSCYTFRVELFTDNEHLFYFNEIYIFKEKLYKHPHTKFIEDAADFIDSPPTYDIKTIIKTAFSSI